MDTPQYRRFIALQSVIAGRFSLEREIGRGGSAIIYLARDVMLGRPVAIKLLNADAAANQAVRQRFLREARTAGVLFQPNIVPIHAVEEHGEMVFFVMGYVDGETLRARMMREGMLEVVDVTRMLREVAWALGYAHGRGITHRDVKPENIMIERDSGRAIVTDFGIARHVDDPHGGEIVGTADYMSPEQAAGRRVDARSDIYSLGATAFHAITGRPPFQAPTDEQVLMLHERQPAPSVMALRAGVPGRLVEIVDRCLSKDPDDRFATAEELASALGDVAGATHRVPAVVDDFLSMARSTTRRLTVLAPFGGVLTYAVGALHGFGIGLVMLVTFIFWILVLELLLPPIALLRAARQVLVQGISYDEFCEILKAQSAEALKASAASPGRAAVSVQRRLLVGTGGLTLALSAFVIAGARAVPETWRLGLMALGVSGIILASGTVGWAVSIMLGNPIGRSMRHGLWLSSFGRRFFRLAAIGSGSASVAERPSVRQPEVILTHAVRSALADLGGLERREEALAVINELETRIGALRAKRDESAGGTTGDGDVAPAEFPRSIPNSNGDAASDRRSARAAANREIEVAITALETIRLDLVRIRSGVGSHEDLRSDLDLARRRVAPRRDPTEHLAGAAGVTAGMAANLR
jgi:serine/threonine-protein kinase